MMKRKIIIHCGVPKTGSSALQVQLARSKETFLNHGYDYPAFGATQAAKAGGITSGNGIVLASTYFPDGHPARSGQSRERETERIRRHIALSDNHTILSSEFFATVPCENLAMLAASLADLGEVHLVFFVREQVNSLAAAYVQQVKRAMCTQMPQTYFEELDFSDRPHLSYNTYFSALKEAAPDAKILVQPYESAKGHSAGLMGLFLEMIDAQIPISDLAQDRVVNLSPSPKEVRLMIEMNKFGPRKKLSDMVVEASHEAGRSQIHTDQRIVPPKAVARIREHYAAENEAFFTNFFQSENIYETHESAANFVDLRDLSFEAEDVMNIILGLMVKMDHRLSALEAK